MDLTLTPDQIDVATALDGLAERFATKPIEFHGFALASDELEQELATAEYFDIATIPDFGPITAALAVERLSQLPYAAEIALSMLVRPHLPGDWLRPLALVENGRPGRFVATAKTLLVIDGDSMGIGKPSADDVEAVDSIYAYPMGRLKKPIALTQLSTAEADQVRKWIRIALASETAGLLKAAVASTVEHVSVRKQFGRPLGTFQALRHRLAECAVLAGGVRWLALKAAWTADEGDAALAAFHAQDSATRVAYDAHQMLGAMGMTLEHPLHLWTYRLKALLSDLNGRAGQAKAVARYCFDAQAKG
jgi:hypothetical protein